MGDRRRDLIPAAIAAWVSTVVLVVVSFRLPWTVIAVGVFGALAGGLTVLLALWERPGA